MQSEHMHSYTNSKTYLICILSAFKLSKVLYADINIKNQIISVFACKNKFLHAPGPPNVQSATALSQPLYFGALVKAPPCVGCRSA